MTQRFKQNRCVLYICNIGSEKRTDCINQYSWSYIRRLHLHLEAFSVLNIATHFSLLETQSASSWLIVILYVLFFSFLVWDKKKSDQWDFILCQMFSMSLLCLLPFPLVGETQLAVIRAIICRLGNITHQVTCFNICILKINTLYHGMVVSRTYASSLLHYLTFEFNEHR